MKTEEQEEPAPPPNPLRGERLLKAAINQILLHPETWDQKVWHSPCRTKHCLAGWCQILAGYPPDSRFASSDARTALGISSGEASYLFARYMTLEEMYHYAKNFSLNGYNEDGWNKYCMSRDHRLRTFPSGADGLTPFDLWK